MLLQRHQIGERINTRPRAGGDHTGQYTGHIGAVGARIKEAVATLTDHELQGPVGLSEGVAPFAGLQNRACHVIPSCNSWSKKDIRGSIELLVSRSTGWGESQKRLPTCRLRGLMSGSSSVQRPGVSGAGR